MHSRFIMYTPVVLALGCAGGDPGQQESNSGGFSSSTAGPSTSQGNHTSTTTDSGATSSSKTTGGETGGGGDGTSTDGDNGGSDSGVTDGTSTGGGQTSGDTTNSTSSSGTTSTSTSTSTTSPVDSDGDPGFRFDVGSDLEVPLPETDIGCNKADFLFVIDNSGSMADEQINLINSFPGFISAIENQTNISDYQIMVVDTDSGSGTGCGSVLGAGISRAAGGTDCGVANGKCYMVKGQTNLTGTFSCIAGVGTGGSGSEKPMNAMEAAVGVLSQAGGVNAGFLRDDAILVVTFITDEEEDGALGGDANSTGTPTTWKQSLVTAKGGDEDAVVVLGLLGDPDVTAPLTPVCTYKDPNDPQGVTGAEPCPILRTFSDSFMFGQWGSVCSASYSTFFQQAISVIAGACEIFHPQR